MPRPTARPGTANRMYRRRIPEDAIHILDRLPDAYRPAGWGKTEITLTLGTSDGRRAAAEHARIADQVERHLQGLRAGARTLSRKQAVALAGALYYGFTEAMVDDPRYEGDWRRVLALNEAARRGVGGTHDAHGSEDEAVATAMEERFGIMVDTLLGCQGLIVDAESRRLLFREFAHALDDAAKQAIRQLGGDYRPDPVAGRFPDWQEERPQAVLPKLALLDLFERWAKHPEQAQTARRTKSRYHGDRPHRVVRAEC